MKKNQMMENRTAETQRSQNVPQTIRIDKWLWAARFFKTRSLAKEAIEGGKVHFDGDRVKVSKEVRLGMQLTIRQGFDEKTVIVKALSAVRGGAPQAQLLYEETPHSITKREFYSSQRKLANLARPDHRPTKRDRRHITQFKHENSMGYSPDDEGY